MDSERLRVCVYCGSSAACDPDYLRAAHRLGEVLAERGFLTVYGGGGIGSMEALADGVLRRGGEIVGVIPRFMAELEWAHSRLSRLELVEDLRVRKHLMLEGSRAVVAMPGGSGTLEELLEAITLKRLGIFLGPIVIVNTRGFFDPLLGFLARVVAERFMDDRHLAMWQVVSAPDEVPAAIESAPVWSAEARSFATRKVAEGRLGVEDVGAGGGASVVTVDLSVGQVEGISVQNPRTGREALDC